MTEGLDREAAAEEEVAPYSVAIRSMPVPTARDLARLARIGLEATKEKHAALNAIEKELNKRDMDERAGRRRSHEDEPAPVGLLDGITLERGAVWAVVCYYADIIRAGEEALKKYDSGDCH